jgi:dTDP-4-amino-4,6-dideoxygalactose transaminase
VITAQMPTQTAFPFLDLKAQFSSIREDVIAAVTRVLDSQQFILGPEVSAFEDEVGQYLGSRFSVGCASGSDALLLGLMALDVGPGDEVITTPFTFVASAGSIAQLDAVPVFVDIDPISYNLDPNQLERAITSKTRAIMPVHLFGLSAEMDSIAEIAGRCGIPIIEDAAQAIGAEYRGKKVGTFGAVGCFSFFPSKNLGCAGDGGLVTTNDPAIADRLKLLHLHGSRNKYEYETLGVNSRLDAIQAAILRVKLRHLDSWSNGRRRNVERYRELIAKHRLEKKIVLPAEPEYCYHVFNQCTVRVEKRDALRHYLQEKGIPVEVYYPFSLHLQPAFKYLGYKQGSMPQSELANAQVLSLPVFAEITREQQESVINEIALYYSKN